MEEGDPCNNSMLQKSSRRDPPHDLLYPITLYADDDASAEAAERRANAAVLDHKDDRADDPPIVHPRNPLREWKIPFNPTHLNPRQQKQINHGEASQPPPMNQPIPTLARTLLGPEPRS
jgi:hypothetical protein